MICSLVTLTLDTGAWVLLPPGLEAVIIPIPWRVLLPFKIHVLWSALSAERCMKCPCENQYSSVLWTTAKLLANLFTSAYDGQKPRLCNVSFNHLETKWWCTCTPRSKCSGVWYYTWPGCLNNTLSDGCDFKVYLLSWYYDPEQYF